MQRQDMALLLGALGFVLAEFLYCTVFPSAIRGLGTFLIRCGALLLGRPPRAGSAPAAEAVGIVAWLALGLLVAGLCMLVVIVRWLAADGA